MHKYNLTSEAMRISIFQFGARGYVSVSLLLLLLLLLLMLVLVQR